MSRNSGAIRIRPLKTIDELKAVEELQLEVWSCSEREVLPSLTLIPLMDIGGILLGAFAGQEIVGFVVGFPGFEEGKRIIHSDMLAVKAEFRSTGLGYQLKLAQREAALAMGIERITWTFDPLQAVNAHFNFAKLGVSADRYKVNYYGETSSALHRTGTDRLWVTWALNSKRVQQRLAGEAIESSVLDPAPALKMTKDHEPLLETFEATQPLISIEIPSDINAIAAADISRAKRWREATRAAFTTALDTGFIVRDFLRGERAGDAGTYLLTQSN